MKRPCNHPGCHELVSGQDRRCPKHATNDPRKHYEEARRKKDPALAMAKRIRSSKQWSDVRRAKLSINPICENPHGLHKRGMEPVASEVHHIERIQDAPELAFSMGNLMSLCTKCHAVFSAQERKMTR